MRRAKGLPFDTARNALDAPGVGHLRFARLSRFMDGGVLPLRLGDGDNLLIGNRYLALDLRS